MHIVNDRTLYHNIYKLFEEKAGETQGEGESGKIHGKLSYEILAHCCCVVCVIRAFVIH